MKESRKGKKIMIITVGLTCFILMAVMFMQFKIVNQTDITSIETMRKTELTTELASWKQKYEETNSKYEETQNKLNEYKNSQQSTEESEKLLEQELEQINKILGKTDVQGQGIIITLKDITQEQATDVSSIKADDLLIIVNALKLAGAEAISINGERIINSTDIVQIKDSFIRINNRQRVLNPYVIKAIGNQAYLEGGPIGSGGHLDDMKNLGHKITIEKSDNITINKYEGEIEAKYME